MNLVPFSILGALEGLSEFLPISSTGHLIIARDLFGLVTGNDLAVDAVLQLATILALVVYFSRDLARLARTALLKVRGAAVADTDLRLLVAVVVGTVPAVIFGLLLEDLMGTVFRSTTLVAYALIVGSFIMLAAEWWGPKLGRTQAALSWRSGLVIGLFQSLALIPGMSRSGMTTAGGMFLGFTRSESTAFGFILSIPVLVGAGGKKLFDLYSSGALMSVGPELAFGSVIAFLIGITTIHVFLMIVRKTPLTIFVVYRLILAALLLTLTS